MSASLLRGSDPSGMLAGIQDELTGRILCIGQHFAMLLATLLPQRYSLQTVPGAAVAQLEFNLTLRPCGLLRLRKITAA